jgi:hypothetical protein
VVVLVVVVVVVVVVPLLQKVSRQSKRFRMWCTFEAA